MKSREEQLRSEAEMAKQLLAASEQERARLYGQVYDEIYSMSLEREPDSLEFGASSADLATVLRETRPGDRVLEIGCGTGLLAIALRDAGRRVVGVDASQVALDVAHNRAKDLRDLELRRVDGVDLPFPDQTFDFAYSVEVIEHLHELDAPRHFAEVCRVLRRGGRYWFKTPSRYSSVSAGERFGLTAEADADVHLKEWTHRELQPVLHGAGFSSVVVPVEHRRLAGMAMPGSLAAMLQRAPGFPDSKLGLALGLSQCLVRATRD